MKYLWLPILLLVSVLLTSLMVSQDYSSLSIFLVSLGAGAALGFVSAKLGHHF